ncbi:MAG: alpha-hydroxy acid oxidase [Ktedonobacteraceae bacterium]
MQPINLQDYEVLAATKMEHPGWDYYQGGSDDEITLRANRAAFAQLQLRPRVLRDVSICDLSTSVLGTPVSMPILVAPTAAYGLAHAEAECATARGVEPARTLMTLSTDSTRSLEEVAQCTHGPLWYQLYIYTFEEAERLVKRAEAANYRALVLTVDLPVTSDIRNDFVSYRQAHHPHVFMGNARHLESGSEASQEREVYVGNKLTWQILPWLRSLTTLPIIVKGILTAEDAELAIGHGAAAIVVSNHGGRQLDGAIASIEALPEIVAAAAGRCEIYMDGGIRRGTDVLKALALGAHAVLVGRPVLWGLAANGAAGVHHVLEILRQELEMSMILSGCPSLKSITPDLIKS